MAEDDQEQWTTDAGKVLRAVPRAAAASGELQPEHVGTSLLCGARGSLSLLPRSGHLQPRASP